MYQDQVGLEALMVYGCEDRDGDAYEGRSRRSGGVGPWCLAVKSKNSMLDWPLFILDASSRVAHSTFYEIHNCGAQLVIPFSTSLLFSLWLFVTLLP